MLRHFPSGRTGRTRIAMVAVLSASLLAAAFTSPAPSLASGDSEHLLNHRKAQVNHRLVGSHADLDEISRQLLTAQADLDSAVSDLSDARVRLAGLQVDVQQAVVRDQQMQQALSAATQRLSDAKSDLVQGRATVARQRRVLAGYAVSNAESQITQLSTLGLVLGAESTHQAIDLMQGADSALERQLTDLQRLQANQVLLGYTEQRVQQATDQIAVDRAAAAANLATTRTLESAAASAESTVEQRVASLQVQRDRLSTAKAGELARIQTMKRERDRLEAQLRRIAERRAAARRAASGGSATSNPPSDGGFLSYPVRNTYVTSPYGMRMHPILHIWELHDGTDFHAECGTPVYAAADGRVTSEYYNTGYGNRLIIDHGFVRGVSLWTSYNHLSSFVAVTGEQVGRGQLIAYSGTTGYSTGCHLHFMVYVNGVTVNPMSWL